MELKVTPIRNGTVIDHITPESGMIVYRLLRQKIAGHPTVVLLNAPSSSMGMKDMIKIEDVFVNKAECDVIALVAPNATINTIKGNTVAEKYRVKMPKFVRGFLKCLNPKCVTNADREPLETHFVVENSPFRLRCVYCDKEYSESLVNETVMNRTPAF